MKRLNGLLKRKKCIICGRFYIIKSNNSAGQKSAPIRPKNSKTCSKACSRIYIDKSRKDRYLKIKGRKK
jgi:predicted nucleic acid-binding Zn ribbon protein